MIVVTFYNQFVRFFDNDESKVAKWSDLKKLDSLETHTVKLSKLNDQAVAPKPIERQNVSLCLNVFCEKILSAMKSHSGMLMEQLHSWKKIFSFFKTMNVKGVYEDVRTRDPLKSTTSSVDDGRLTF